MPITLASHDLLAALQDARRHSDSLFETLHHEVWFERPIARRHRIVFYVGHLEAFDYNLLLGRPTATPSGFPDFDKLFEFGIDPAPGQLPSDTPSDWPSLGALFAYRRHVRDRVDAALADAPSDLIHIAIEHRLMHIETLAYLFHDIDFQQKRRPMPVPTPPSIPFQPEWISIPAGLATLGQAPGDDFGWDNEFVQHQVPVDAFQISRHKVTNGDYLAHVQAGHPAPNFWRLDQGRWYLKTMFAEVPLPLDWPVWVSHQEATAYASAQGARLMTEPEFHRAAFGKPNGSEAQFSPKTPGNFDFRHWDPVPVTAYPEGDSPFGVSQLVGNGWEWTSTPFLPFDGFHAHPSYPGYSADFFDGEHFVLKGASPRTAAVFTRNSFRNWFRRDYPHVYAGFHLVR